MKKLLVIAIAAAMVAGCEPAIEPELAPNGSLRCTEYGMAGGIAYDKVSIDGHDYIVASGIRCVSIIHAESCPCKISK
jgi:hypothetical protein